MKRKLTILLVLLLSLQITIYNQRSYSQPVFSDVDASYWAVKEIEMLKQKDLIHGYNDGTFLPETSISRAEAAAILVRMLSLNTGKGLFPFRDVPLWHWAKDDISIAYQNKLLAGYEDGTIHPDDSITRAETAELLTKAFKLSNGIPADTFIDVGKQHWAYDSVNILVVNGLIEGKANDQFDPEKPITRAEYSVVLARALEKKIPFAIEQSVPASSVVYELIPEDWGIYNDGTHPEETTKGFNDALAWAHARGMTTFKVPAGTYTIKKGNPKNRYTPDLSASINMVPDMRFELHDQAIIQKESNGYPGYTLLYIGPDAHHVTLKGGTYRGDKDTHDYSSPDTHENGVGIMTAGAHQVTIDGVKAENFTGDGLVVGAYGKQINVLQESDFESGAVDDHGHLIADPKKIRTKNMKTNFNDPIFQTQRTIHFSLPQNISKQVPFSLYFYKSDGTFLSSVKNQEISWSHIDVPADAGYYYAVFDTSGYKGISLNYWVRFVTKNAIVKNSEFAFNRRQGITVGGVDNLLIMNNKIHDIKGTAPQSGIDIEGGIGENGNRNTNIFIKNNEIYNNALYNVILYDGENVTVEDNYLGPNDTKSSVGVAVSSPFRTGAVIKNNTFDGSKIAVGNESAFIGNHMMESVASITGQNVSIDGMVFTDSSLRLNSDVPFGITASNITMRNNKKNGSGLVVNKQPVHLTDVSISGESTLWSISGDAADGSIFDNLKIIGYGNDLNLPRGTYNNCVFEAAGENTGSPRASQAGRYVFDSCTMKTNKSSALSITGDADVTVKNSTLDVSGALFGSKAVIMVEKAKAVTITNNIIRAMDLTVDYIAAIKINNYGAAGNPTDVFNATITGNTISTNIAAKGISTIDAGTNAPAYTIENNILSKAKLELRRADINNNNAEK